MIWCVVVRLVAFDACCTWSGCCVLGFCFQLNSLYLTSFMSYVSWVISVNLSWVPCYRNVIYIAWSTYLNIFCLTWSFIGWNFDNLMLFCLIHFMVCISKIQFQPADYHWLLYEAWSKVSAVSWFVWHLVMKQVYGYDPTSKQESLWRKTNIITMTQDAKQRGCLLLFFIMVLCTIIVLHKAKLQTGILICMCWDIFVMHWSINDQKSGHLMHDKFIMTVH